MKKKKKKNENETSEYLPVLKLGKRKEEEILPSTFIVSPRAMFIGQNIRDLIQDSNRGHLISAPGC